MTSVEPQKFYGIATSFYPQHGLNTCVMVDEGDGVVKTDSCWQEEDRTQLKQAFERLLKTVVEVTQLQAEENRKTGHQYSVPITLGFAKDAHKDGELNKISSDSTAQLSTTIQKYIKDKIVSTIHNNTDSKYQPEAVELATTLDFRPSNMSSTSSIPDNEAKEGGLAQRNSLAQQGYPDAWLGLFRSAYPVIQDIVNKINEKVKQDSSKPRFFFLAEPLHRWFNLPSILNPLKEVYKIGLGIPPEEEVDFKFSDSPEEEPLFYVNRVRMLNAKPKIPTQKFYGLAISFYNHQLSFCTMVDNGDGDIKVKHDKTWVEDDIDKSLLKLLEDVKEVARLQYAENQHTGNDKYQFTVSIGWPGDSEVPELAALKDQHSGKSETGMPIFDAIKEKIDNCITEATDSDFKIDSTMAQAELTTKAFAPAEDPELEQDVIDLFKEAHDKTVANRDLNALRNLLEYSIPALGKLLKEIAASSSPFRQALEFVILSGSETRFLDLPPVVKFLQELLKLIYQSDTYIDIKFPGDPSDPHFFNVNKPHMEKNIKAALSK